MEDSVLNWIIYAAVRTTSLQPIIPLRAMDLGSFAAIEAMNTTIATSGAERTKALAMSETGAMIQTSM